MPNIEKAKQIIEENKPIIKKRFKVKNIGLFGSCLRGEQKSGSDLDILVEFSEPVGFFAFLELEEYLEAKLGMKVDLVTKQALKPNIGRHILKEVLYL